MSAIAAAQWTAVATIALALFAVVTALFAYLAFRAQSEQIGTLKEQAADEKSLIKLQADLLQAQSDQLKVQQQQFEDQRAANVRQTEVTKLQAQELRESLDERKREAGERRRAQASLVFIDASTFGDRPPTEVTAHVYNRSREPIYGLQLRWYCGVAADGVSHPLDMILPEGELISRHEFPPGTKMGAADVVLRFRDAAGVMWRRRRDGTLTELDDE